MNASFLWTMFTNDMGYFIEHKILYGEGSPLVKDLSMLVIAVFKPVSPSSPPPPPRKRLTSDQRKKSFSGSRKALLLHSAHVQAVFQSRAKDLGTR